MSFRIHAKNFALTYPQIGDLTKEQFRDELIKLNPSYLLIGEEKHADGGRHVHILFQSAVKLNIRRATYFDILGRHPNLQGCKNLLAWMEYVKKEDTQCLEFGKTGTKRTWAEALNVGSEEEFYSTISDLSPRDFILSHQRIKDYGKRRFSIPEVYTPQFSEFHITTHMRQWVEQRSNNDRPKSLVLIGPSRLGKTEWARSLGTHMYWNGMLNLDDWNGEAEYAILDDFKWDYVPCKKAFFGAQKTFTLTDKYRKKKTVQWGKPIIYLCNPEDDPFINMSHTEKAWYDMNCIYSTITNKLF